MATTENPNPDQPPTDDWIIEQVIQMAERDDLVEREGKIDWPDSLDRIESWLRIDLGSDVDSPLIRRIVRAVRKVRSAS